ncbi:MAG TPA: DNA-directed RNA polymerase subunit omega [Candidatus Omnitrophota bacterium]|jgi:DNA-directed RNA polymerase omega subunit|nr:DNA-directed RNA polymerase subunit omega [Candidatus Omnitrophota bacterium]HPN55277.1 DNA-directed RNA polymerase subunit omega [Candidatus Omnitrophota bacterium]
MGYPPLEDLLPKTDYSIYKLVRMASNRAVELADGKPRLIETPSLMKTTTIALEEIQNAKVVLKDVAERFLPDQTHGKKTGGEPAEA